MKASPIHEDGKQWLIIYVSSSPSMQIYAPPAQKRKAGHRYMLKIVAIWVT